MFWVSQEILDVVVSFSMGGRQFCTTTGLFGGREDISLSFHSLNTNINLSVYVILIMNKGKKRQVQLTYKYKKKSYISSSSSCQTVSTDIFGPLSPPLPIVHCFWQVFRATSSTFTKLLYVCSSWTSCHRSSMWKGPQGYITYEHVSTSPAVFRISGSSNFHTFHDG